MVAVAPGHMGRCRRPGHWQVSQRLGGVETRGRASGRVVWWACECSRHTGAAWGMWSAGLGHTSSVRGFRAVCPLERVGARPWLPQLGRACGRAVGMVAWWLLEEGCVPVVMRVVTPRQWGCTVSARGDACMRGPSVWGVLCGYAVWGVGWSTGVGPGLL